MSRSLKGLLNGATWVPEFNVALFAVLLDYPWEFLQTPLFELPDAPHWKVIKTCSLATLGDAAIMLAAYWMVALVQNGRSWIVNPSVAGVMLFSSIGVAVTIVIERLATSGLWYTSWSYSQYMPVVPGIGVGLSPLLQWIVLPPLVVWFVKRQLATA